MRTFVNAMIGEANGANLQAEIYQEESGYSITYSINGQNVKAEQFPNKSIYFVEDAAKNWLSGIKKLNG